MRDEFEKWFKVRYPEKKYQAVKEVMYDAFLSGAEIGQRILEAANQSAQVDSLTPRAVEDDPDPQSRALTSGSPIHASR